MEIQTPIRPLYEHILIKRLPKVEKTKGGIVIPISARLTPIRGEVLAIGRGRVQKNGERAKIWVEPGDTVIYSEHAEKTVAYKDNDLLLIEDEDIFGLVNGGDNEIIEPLNDRLIVKRAKRDEVTQGGIILTGKKTEQDRGYVLSKGPKVTVFVDDLILFKPFDGLEFEMNGEAFLMLREQDIMGVIE